ncbi:ATP-binding protein [Trabulsiella odontotermitis]|uniref:ATP-binding protein n=1 Tax=Trabulsiella odontotermitis TaxID=379893 RepID=UPI0024B77CAB|nr:ATP-binding protein [Trabulsiella odontotermitis]WHP32834.1 ATP-binding protein [Trabulsiella odontotermitis]
MANPFDTMAGRMDAATVRKMGRTAVINGVPVDVIPAELIEQMGPVSGNMVSLVVFSETYRPRRNDDVVYEGETFSVTRHDKFNGKPRIFIE